MPSGGFGLASRKISQLLPKTTEGFLFFMSPEEKFDNAELFKVKLRKDSVVQINEHGQEGWIGCFVQVDEVKAWGIQGWVQIPKGGQAYIRLKYEEVCYIGEAVMTQPDDNADSYSLNSN